jgi:DNA-binding transcriptional ArsR family regulator
VRRAGKTFQSLKVSLYFPGPETFIIMALTRDMRTSEDPAQLDRMFFALSDGSRRAMLDSLSKAPASVSDLAQPLQMALPSAVKHLTVLEQGGLVLSEKTGRVRTYRVAPNALAAMEAWVARRKTLLNAQFDRLDAYLNARHKGSRK